MKFSEVKIGEPFESHGMSAVKLTSRSFRITSGSRAGEIRSTSGTRNVNGLSGDKAHAAKQKSDRVRLNEIAQSAGYANWSALSRAVLAGHDVHIRGAKPPMSGEFQKVSDLTKNLSQQNDKYLFISTPMAVGGDSTDVERWITEHWTCGEINDENYQLVAERFISWYRGEK